MDDSCRVQMNATGSAESPDHLSASNSPLKTPKYLYSCPLRRQQHVTEKNVAWSFLCSIIGVLLALVIGVPTMAILALMVPVILTLRRSVTSCVHRQLPNAPRDMDPSSRSCCCCSQDGRCHKGHPVSPLDSVWLQPHAFGTSVVHSVMIVEGALSVAKVRELVLSRLLGGRDSRGRRVYPRFSQRVVTVLSGYRWVDDECFDVDNHVIPVHDRISSREELERLVGALVAKPLLFDHPLWEVLVLESCLECSSETNTRERDTVLVIRTHQCLTDGMSLLTLLRTCLADHPTTPAALASATTFRPHFGGMVFPLNVLRACVVGPWTMFSWLFCGRKDCNPLARGMPSSNFGAVGGRVAVAWSDAVDLARVTRVKQVTRSTVNDVLMAALAGSLRTYFQSQGVQRPYDIKVSLPIDLRYEPKQLKRPVSLGTEFASVNVSLPTSREGAIPRLWEVRGITDDLKTSADPVVMYGALYFLQALLPECASRAIINRLLNRASLAMHNVPGPEAALFLASRRLKAILCLIPPRDSVAVSVTVVTYADTLRVAVLADLAILPDPQPVIKEFHAQINIMANLLANRRLPGEHRRRSFQIHPMSNFTPHPQLEQIQRKLHDVQEELQDLSERLDGASASSCQQLRAGEQELQTRLEELKEEFLELLTELRRRKSIAEGVSLSDDDEDLDGELRRPRRRAMSISSRKSSVSITSTSRPLTTPTTSQHSVLAQLMDEAAATTNFDQHSNRSLSPSQDHG